MVRGHFGGAVGRAHLGHDLVRCHVWPCGSKVAAAGAVACVAAASGFLRWCRRRRVIAWPDGLAGWHRSDRPRRTWYRGSFLGLRRWLTRARRLVLATATFGHDKPLPGAALLLGSITHGGRRLPPLLCIPSPVSPLLLLSIVGTRARRPPPLLSARGRGARLVQPLGAVGARRLRRRQVGSSRNRRRRVLWRRRRQWSCINQFSLWLPSKGRYSMRLTAELWQFDLWYSI
mmetsp:Transcript_109400/g.308691  ORF Transcript_109400/g.308691 Transcript_109400/m.308691 type:complete len:231 (+) Transcript_109400:1324-2016(+)